MKRHISRALAATFLVWSLGIVPVAIIGQTRIAMPKNKYKIQDDVKLGRQAAVEAERQFPVLNDRQAEDYVSQVGQRLVAAIPPQFQHPEFNYRFKVVNASDINAFALPGGPMYVNRGMIEAARNEGEMAGVMAHEISHVALRHATAQATKQGSVGNQLGMIGMILGGAILGGQSGAQLGALGAQAWMTKYSREYETQADVLGAQIMADAGYDPRDLANMFRTIAQQGGSRAPQWLSGHPDPGNRFDKINREATMLRVSSNPIKVTREFSRVQERLRGMPRSRTMAQIQQDYQRNGGASQNPTYGGRYSQRVELPSTRYRTYTGGNWVELQVPDNWREFSTSSQVSFAPEGGYGDQGITHGVMIGIVGTSNSNLNQATQEYVNSLLQGNSYLSQRGGYSRTYIGGRQGFSTVLSGRSSLTGRAEVVTIYTTQLQNGDLFYVATVSPDDESYNYNSAFRNVLNSIRLNG